MKCGLQGHSRCSNVSVWWKRIELMGCRRHIRRLCLHVKEVKKPSLFIRCLFIWGGGGLTAINIHFSKGGRRVFTWKAVRMSLCFSKAHTHTHTPEWPHRRPVIFQKFLFNREWITRHRGVLVSSEILNDSSQGRFSCF